MRAISSVVKKGGSGVGPLLLSQEKFNTADGTCLRREGEREGEGGRERERERE